MGWEMLAHPDLLKSSKTFGSSQDQIKPSNLILLLTECCDVDLYCRFCSYSFADTPVSVTVLLIQEFLSRLLNLIFLLWLGMARPCCYLPSLSMYCRDSRASVNKHHVLRLRRCLSLLVSKAGSSSRWVLRGSSSVSETKKCKAGTELAQRSAEAWPLCL